MKVLLILFSPDERDSGTLALDICRNAGRFGIDVSAAVSEPGALEEQIRTFSRGFHLIDSASASDLNSLYRLRKFIRTQEADIVHAFGIDEFILGRLATIGKVPVKRVLHLQDIDFDSRSLPGKFASAVRSSDAALLPARSAFPVLRTAGIDTRKNVFYCPPGSDAGRLSAHAKQLKMDLGLDNRHVLIGMTAPFEGGSEIDHMTVCRALPKVFSKFDNARFLFAGMVQDDGDRTLHECAAFCDEEGIGEKVYFVTEDEGIEQALSSLDIFVYSTASHTVPIAVAEAMLLGIPVVVSDTEFLAEMTDGGKCADVFVRGDAEELADKLISLIKSDKLRKKRSEEAEKFAAANYSIEKHVMSLKALYSELIQR